MVKVRFNLGFRVRVEFRDMISRLWMSLLVVIANVSRRSLPGVGALGVEAGDTAQQQHANALGADVAIGGGG